MTNHEIESGSKNTDKEIWCKVKDDYYSPSIHITEQGSIGIKVGGSVIVMPIEKWFSLAQLFLEVKGMPKPLCDYCNGNGWTSEHDRSFGSHDKTTGDCLGTCPIPEQCGFCQGTGIDENKKKIIDLCTTHLVKKCEGIEEIQALKDICIQASMPINFATKEAFEKQVNYRLEDLAQAIKEYLLKE